MKQNVIDDYNLLSGQQKAAILMMSLDEDKSAQIFALMDDEEIKELSVIMASLGKVNSNVVEQLFQEFAEKSSNTGTLIGTFESTERLLSKTLDKDRVSAIMEEISGPAGRTMWDKLGNVNEHVLANYLKNEYPQTIAVILSKIKAEHAAKVIALLPENFAMEIVMRMLRMDSVQKEVLDGLEKTLRKEFMSNLSKSTRRDSHELIADIFNSLDRNTEGRFMEALEERNRESAERVKSLMFTFEDLVRVDSQGIQVLLRKSTRTSWQSLSKALPKPSRICSSTICLPAPAKSSRKIWKPWGRFVCATSKRLSSISLPRPKSCPMPAK